MKTLPVSSAHAAAVAAFEASIRELGEGPARLDNVADLLVGMLEARRDHKIEIRAKRDGGERARRVA